jgi:hypothetical protein
VSREVRVGKGQSAVAISGALAGTLLDELRKAMGAGVYGVLDNQGRRLTASARATWPVKTGKSRAALDYHIRIDPDAGKIEVVIGTVGYARYIKSTKIGDVQTLAPGASAAPLIALARSGDGPAPIDYAQRIRSPLAELQKAAKAATKLMGPLLRDTLIKALGGKSG